MNAKLLRFSNIFKMAADHAVLFEGMNDPEVDLFTDTEDDFALSAADLLTLDAGVIDNADKIIEALRSLGSSALDAQEKQKLIEKWKTDVEAAKMKGVL